MRRAGVFTWVCGLLILTSSAARALPPNAPSPLSPWRDGLWITASGALLGATLTGVFAIQADALRERARGMWSDSPEVPGLSRDARQASALAIGFGVGAVLFGAASVFLLVEAPGVPAARSGGATLAPIVGPSTAGVCWRGSLP